ncbi:MAG: S8 family serine peptidase, partial [Candidatus Hydrogenedentes bacterium]|nr:S8 family serine peptidase [Candidatus Hydrogenedentota bacterium]
MRGRMKFETWVVIGLLVTGISAAGQSLPAPPAPGAPPDAYFHGWRGRYTPLQLSEKRIAVTFEKGVSDEGVRNVLSYEPALDISALQLDFQTLEAPCAFAVPTKVGTKREDIKQILEELKRFDGVESANPVYVTNPERESALTDYFYVNVATATPEDAVLKQFGQDGLEVFKRNDYRDIGVIGYRLKVTKEAMVAASLDAIGFANRYYDNPLFLESVPTFAPLYNVETDDPQFPSDPLYNSSSQFSQGQWNLYAERINGPAAWQLVYGVNGVNADLAPKIIMAVLDNGVAMNYGTTSWLINGTMEYLVSAPTSGFDLAAGETLGGHPDLNPNQWINETEIASDDNPDPDIGQGEDDDGNGKTDDYYGWDFVGDKAWDPSDEDNIPFPDEAVDPGMNNNRGHGHGAAGTAAAAGNNSEGLAGVCWTAKIMPIRYHNNTAEGTSVPTFDVFYAGHAEDGLRYAVQNGAKVLAFMCCIDVYDPGIYDAVKWARQQKCTIASPNGNWNYSIDAHPTFPSSWPEVIAVGASRRDPERRTGYSNYGWATDVVAPSTDPLEGPGSGDNPIIGTAIQGYGGGGGTSKAMPEVAGLAALMMTANTSLSPAEIQAFMGWSALDLVYTNGSEVASAGRDYYTGWGRINAAGAVQLAQRSRFAIKDEYGRNIASWDADGNFVLDGELKEFATPQELSITDLVTPNYPEFVVRTGNANGTPNTVVARLDPSWTDGMPTFYLKGELKTTWVEPSVAASEFIIQQDDYNKRAYIDAAGNMYVKGRIFIGSNPDEAGVYTVNAPAGKEGIINFAYSGGNGIQNAINSANVPDHSIIVVYPGTYNLITFPSYPAKNLVVRSTDPYSATTVAATVIEGPYEEGYAVVNLGGGESEDCSVMGFTVRGGRADNGGGITGAGSRASIMYNVFEDNIATWGGGAISSCHGLIQGNTIGKSGAPNLAMFGAGLSGCNGTIRRNVIRYNEASSFGAGLAYCNGEITQNYIAHNDVDGDGGGLALCNGIVRCNIIYSNVAGNRGAGLYDCDATVIEQNTVYDNRIATGGHVAGMYNCGPNTTV